MPSYVTAKKNTEFIFYVSLVSQADTKLFQTNPTLAAGDVKVSTDGGVEANISALPVVTPAASKRIKVTLSAGEMNGDNTQVTFSDVAGSEWCDLTINIQTSTIQIDDLTRSTTPANTLDIDGDGNVTVGNLVSGSSSINTTAESFTLTTGSVASGFYTDTTSINSTYHQIQDSAGTLECYYQFDIGANGSPVQATLTGKLNSANDSLNVYAYNWGSTSWELLGPLAGQDGSTDAESTFTFFTQHVGTGANLGKVRLRFQGTGLTSANLYVDQVYVSYAVVSISAGYGGFVWLDTINGTSGTVSDYNGTSDRPVNNLADAITIANNKGLSRIKIANGTSITFVQAMDNFSLLGELWTLSLNGQSCSDSVIVGATVSGTCTGANKPCFRDCKIGTVTIPPCYIHDSGLQTTLTVGSAGDYYLEGCYSMVAGGGTPIIDFDATIGNTNMNIRKYSGGVEFQNIGQSGTDAISLEGWGQYIINANCIGGNLSVRGNFKKTDNGSVTIDEVAEYNTTQVRDAMKLAPTAGSPATGSIDKHLDDVVADTGTDGVVVAAGSKTGYSLSTAGIKAIWDQLTSALTAAASIGKLLVDNINATISSRSSHSDPDPSGYIDVAISSRSSHSAANVWSVATRTLTSFGTLITDIWANVARTLTAGTKDTEIDAIKVKTDNLPTDPASETNVNANETKIDTLQTDVTAIKAKTDNLPDGVKKNTALSNFMFFMVDSTDGYTGETGLTVTATRSIDGVAFAACANSVSEVTGGVYKINLAASDLNGDTIMLKFSATGARDRLIEIITQS